MSNAISIQILDEMLELGVSVVQFLKKTGLPRSVNEQLNKIRHRILADVWPQAT